MLRVIHAQESKKADKEKASAVMKELCSMKLKEAAKKVEDGIKEPLICCDFHSEHWTRIRTNNCLERLNREIRRTLVVGRLRGSKKYMNMKHLEAALADTSFAD